MSDDSALPYADLGGRRNRWHGSGDVRLPVPMETRLWTQVDKTGDCWLWTGTLNWKGYGRFWAFGKTQGVHRVVYRLANPGRDITGVQIDHTCHNADPSCPADRTCVHRRCVNPDHLEAVDNWTNTRRSQNFMARRGSEVVDPPTHCSNGHEYTEENTYRWKSVRRCRTCQRNYQAEYQKRPGQRVKRAARQRLRNQTPEGKAQRSAYKTSAAGRAAAAAYARSPEGRAKNREAVRRHRASKAALANDKRSVVGQKTEIGDASGAMS